MAWPIDQTKSNILVEKAILAVGFFRKRWPLAMMLHGMLVGWLSTRPPHPIFAIRRVTRLRKTMAPKDAQVILHMLRIGATQRYVDPLATGINDLQELSKTHETISRMKTQTWRRILTHYLPLYFPEIARFAGNSRSDWFLALIQRFPTPATITALDREAFSAAAWPLIGRKGLQSTAHQRHLRDGVRLGSTAGARRLSRHHHVPHGHRAGARPHPAARRNRAAGPCTARR